MTFKDLSLESSEGKPFSFAQFVEVAQYVGLVARQYFKASDCGGTSSGSTLFRISRLFSEFVWLLVTRQRHSIKELRVLAERWRIYSNTVRPYSSQTTSSGGNASPTGRIHGRRPTFCSLRSCLQIRDGPPPKNDTPLHSCGVADAL
jgi:hypothetical protein